MAGYVESRPDGGYRVRWRDPSGRQRAKRFPKGKKRDADAFLVSVQADMLHGRYIDVRAGRETVGAYARRWSSAQVWRASSHARTDHIINAQIVPTFGGRPLQSVRRSDVQAWVRSMSSEGGPKGKGLAATTVESYYRCLAAIMLSAVKDKLIHESPCVGIGLPKKNTTGTALVPLTSEQVQRLADAVDERFGAMILAQAGLGLRQGELRGLTVDRINFLKREVIIDRQLIGVEGDAPVFGPPKTSASVRTIPLASRVGELLAAHLARWPAGETGLVFTTKAGAPIGRSQYSTIFREAAAAIGADATSHDLRHHAAAMLISAGCSVKAVQSFLGHATAAETLDTYGHLWPGDEDRIRAAIDAALRANVDTTCTEAQETAL